MVKFGEKEYPTYIDEYGVQRFYENSVIRHLRYTKAIDLNELSGDFFENKFTQIDFLEFNMALGYSVSGLAELSYFQDLEIDNPLWHEATNP